MKLSTMLCYLRLKYLKSTLPCFRSGFRGGGIFWASKAEISRSLNHGWSRISCTSFLDPRRFD
jgi:hypothetical protein